MLLVSADAPAGPHVRAVLVDHDEIAVSVVERWAPGCAPTPGRSWLDVDFELRTVSCTQTGGATCRSFAVPRSAGACSTRWPQGLRSHLANAEDERLLGFALTPNVNPITPPESGLQWPEAGGEFETSGPGLGVQIEVQHRTLALIVTGYDDEGEPTWWFDATPLGAVHGPIATSLCPPPRHPLRLRAGRGNRPRGAGVG